MAVPTTIRLENRQNKPDIRSTRLLIITNVVTIILWFLTFTIIEKSKVWYRGLLWFASFFMDFFTQLYITRNQKQLPFRGSHLPERIGLFTIIVLGECVIAVLTEGANGIKLYSKAMYELSNMPKAALGGPIIVPQALPGSIQLFETLFISFLFIITAFCYWWMYFDDFASHITNIYKLKNISIFDRFRNVWIYIHLPYHLLFTLCGMAMVDSMIRVFVNELQQTATQPAKNATLSMSFSTAQASDSLTTTEAKDPSEIKSEEDIALELILIFAFTFFINGIFKLIHTYNSEGKRMKFRYFHWV
jgi:low temperature requirement protein LtrA